MGFLQSCFSLLFGDPDPNNSPVGSLEQRRSNPDPNPNPNSYP